MSHGPVNSVGRRRAKLTLWSPFIGLFLMIVLGGYVGNREEVAVQSLIAIYAICSLFFVGGRALGFKTLRRIKVEGSKGIKGRVLIGMVLNGLLLCVALSLTGFGIYVSELKAKLDQQEASDKHEFDAKINAVNTGFALQVKNLQSRYEASWAELSNNASILDMSEVKNLDELKDREQKIGGFIAACTAFLEFSENPQEVYRQELIKQQYAPKARERMVKNFTKSIGDKNQLIIVLRQSDLHRSKSLLKTVSFLDTTWGQWDYNPATKQIQFRKTADAEEYNSDLKEFKAATDEVLKIKEQMTPKAISK